MSIRRQSRQAALQILYQDDFNPERSRDPDRQYVSQQLEDNDDGIVFAWQLIDGVRGNREQIDQLIANAAERWELNRLTGVDRNIIRLAVFENQYINTPLGVAIDEAVRAAKRFGGKDSPAFVNGVLDFILTGKTKPEPGEAATEAETPSGSVPGPGLRRFLKARDVSE